MAARSRSSSTAQGPKSDAYVGLLFISLLAQIAGVVFFALDFYGYPDKKPTLPPPPTATTPAGGGAGGNPVPGPGAGGGMPGGAGAAGGMPGGAGAAGGMAGGPRP